MSLAILMVLSLVSVPTFANNESKEKVQAFQTNGVIEGENQNTHFSNMSDDELLEEMERLENEKIQLQSDGSKASVDYTVELEFYKKERKQTGYRVAGNQPPNGVNFGSSGGAFGYIDGNSSSAISLTFGVSGYLISFNIGVGDKAADGVGGYSINADPNKFVKLYVNKTVEATTYKRYKVYHINGYREAYGYTTTSPVTYDISFSVR